jgi:hypothetical protein
MRHFHYLIFRLDASAILLLMKIKRITFPTKKSHAAHQAFKLVMNVYCTYIMRVMRILDV